MSTEPDPGPIADDEATDRWAEDWSSRWSAFETTLRDVDALEATGRSHDAAVEAVVGTAGRLVSLDIDAALLRHGDAHLLADAVVEAVAQAHEAWQERADAVLGPPQVIDGPHTGGAGR